MKPLLFTLKAEPDQRLDLSPLTPDRLVGRSAKEIEAIAIGTTRLPVKVGDVFKVKLGEATSVRFDGGSDRFDLLGAKLLPGFEIHVEGDVGAQLGRAAKAEPSRSPATPVLMRRAIRGRIDIDGDCRGFPGRAARGRNPRHVRRPHRRAWQRGARCRTGCAAASSSSRATPARIWARAIAGTIIVMGTAAGERIGYLNKRASIVLSEQRDLGPTYVDCGAHNLGFAKLFAKSLAPESRGAARLLSSRLQRFAGDTAVFGKGEVLLPA